MSLSRKLLYLRFPALNRVVGSSTNRKGENPIVKTTRNFVFLTFIFAALIALELPQREMAQTLNNEIAKVEIKDSINDPVFVKSSTGEVPSADKFNKNPVKENQTNSKTPVAKASAAATALSSSAAAVGYFSATAYCLNGRTASGSGVRRGIIAADPRVLPLGTRVLITAGTWSGTYTVADTGGAIKGRKIDVWVPSSSEARRFGRRKVHIAVLGKK